MVTMKPIGFARTDAEKIPRHWSVSDVVGRLVIDKDYVDGLVDIKPGDKIIVLFHFDRSPEFKPGLLRQTPLNRDRPFGVFSICSPVRPNPIGLSVLEVLDIKDGEVQVKGLDMLDNTPILDIKPNIQDPTDCPSCPEGTKE